MKRFIDLRGQVYNDDDLPPEEQTPCFAFFCTSTDRFETFNASQEWGSIEEFTEDFDAHDHPAFGAEALKDRLLNLVPSWVK